MADAKSIEINGIDINIKDAKAREDIEKLDTQYKDIANQ